VFAVLVFGLFAYCVLIRPVCVPRRCCHTGSVGLAFTSATVEGNAVCVRTLQGPGIIGSNVWLLPDPTTAAAMPEPYVWPLSVAAAPTSIRLGSGRMDGKSAMIGAAVGASVGGAALLVLLGVCCWCCVVKPRRQRMYSATGSENSNSKDCADRMGSGRLSGSGQGGVYGPQGDDSGLGRCVSIKMGQGVGLDTRGVPDAAEQLPVAHVVKQQLPAQGGSSGHSAALHTADMPLSSDGPSSLASGSRSASGSGYPNLNAVVTGLQRWKTAISSTTMQVMERRMHSIHSTPPLGSMNASSSRTTTGSGATGVGLSQSPAGAGSAAAAAAAVRGQPQQAAVAAAAAMPSLQLLGVLGQGSFGCVYMGIW
jgi:hypothetical protein